MLMGVRTCIATMQIRKVGLDLPQDSAITLLGIYLKDPSSYYRDSISTLFIVALAIIVRN